MPYGINIYNTAGNIIINQDYTNYHVVSSGTVANGGNWPTVGTNQILYIRASVSGAQIYNPEENVFGASPAIVAVTGGAVMEYVIVERTPSVSSATHGFRVYQSDGVTIAYDSGRSPIKVVSSLMYTAPSNGNYTFTDTTINQPFAVPAGRKRYISGQSFRDEAMLWFFPTGFFGFIPYPGFEKLTWTSDMQQTIVAAVGGYSGYLDLQSTKIWLTIDI